MKRETRKFKAITLSEQEKYALLNERKSEDPTVSLDIVAPFATESDLDIFVPEDLTLANMPSLEVYSDGDDTIPDPRVWNGHALVSWEENKKKSCAELDIDPEILILINALEERCK